MQFSFPVHESISYKLHTSYATVTQKENNETPYQSHLTLTVY